MKQSAGRRDFLKTALGGAAALSLGPLAARAVAAGERAAIIANPLNDNLTVFSGAGCNVVAAREGTGIALVDGGQQERSGDLMKAIEGVYGKARVSTLFNTHWHPEQTGSNVRLGNAGATIIAHENTRLWLGYANPMPGQPGHSYGPLPPKARPNKTLYATEKLQVGDEPVECGYLLQAHTDGDIYVFFRKSNVLVTGGPVSGEGWPFIDYRTGGWILGMIDGLRTLIGLADTDTRIVPANGPVLKRSDLEAQRAMYATIADRLSKMLRQGLAPDEAVARTPTKEFDAKWGEPTQFVGQAFRSLWGHMAPDA
jgi:glyoxylase-like metal-dependent hydrolase (beta-lactamase superfamily II)